MISSISTNRLLENAHLPFDRLMALSKVEGWPCPHRLMEVTSDK
jgi:hypothetical protein